MTCRNCGHNEWHADSEPSVCSKLDCKCEHYQEATPEDPVHIGYEEYLQSIENVQDKVAYLLRTFPEHRDTKADELIKKFKELFGDTAASETITRTRRMLRHINPELYDKTSQKFISETSKKEFAFEQYATSC